MVLELILRMLGLVTPAAQYFGTGHLETVPSTPSLELANFRRFWMQVGCVGGNYIAEWVYRLWGIFANRNRYATFELLLNCFFLRSWTIMSSKHMLVGKHFLGQTRTKRAPCAHALYLCMWRLRCFLSNVCLVLIICYYLSDHVLSETYCLADVDIAFTFPWMLTMHIYIYIYILRSYLGMFFDGWILASLFEPH